MIVGLGNPGDRYEKTKHNVGFIALDYFVGRAGHAFSAGKMKGSLASFRLDDTRVYALKPQTFMNLSGESVAPVARYFGIAVSDILVVHDDLDVTPGRLKMALGGGSGGHNGIRSIISQLGSPEFGRFKIGVGHPRDSEETRDVPVDRYVLSRFSTEQWNMLRENLSLVEEGIRLFATRGMAAAMNRVNRKTPQ